MITQLVSLHWLLKPRDERIPIQRLGQQNHVTRPACLQITCPGSSHVGRTFPLVGDCHAARRDRKARFGCGAGAALGQARRGGGEREAAAGHVTGKAPDGRRPSSAPPERPARPRHGVLLQQRKRGLGPGAAAADGVWDCGLRPRDLGPRIEPAVVRSRTAGSRSTEAWRGQITERTARRALLPSERS